MPVRDYSIYTGFRRGGVAEFQITGTRRGGGVEIPIGPVTPAAPVNSVAPVTSGTTTLTSTAGTFTGGSGALTYATRWQRSTDSGTTWAVISGQTGLTYDASAETAGNQIRSQRQATDAMGQTSGWASSNVITIGAAAVVPARTTASTLTRTGDTINSAGSVWTGTQPMTFWYGWQRRPTGGGTWVNIVGFEPAETVAKTFAVLPEDGGYDIRMTERALNSAGSTGNLTSSNFISIPVAAVAPANTAAPVISGGAAEGDAYVHAGDTWTGTTPMTPTYNWELSVDNGAWTQFSTAASPVRPAGHAGNRVRLTKTMTNSVTGTSVMSNILNIAADAAPSNLRAGTVTDPGVGLYLNWNRYTEVHGSPFIDHLKLGDGWRSSGGGNLNWNQLLAAGHIDAEGRAISKPAGADNLLFPALAAMPAQSDGSRRYRLFYEGNITNGWVVGSADNQDTGTDHGLNYIDFDYTANGSNSASLLLDSWTGTVTLRGLVRHDDLADFHLGHTFRRPWLEMLRNTRMLRFVDWMTTENYEGSGLWADRYTPGRATYQGGEGVPVEVMCQLCNLIGADPWFSLVSNADDNYVTQFMTVARNTLDATRHMYLEPSSKVWDGANYSTADHFRALAVSWFGDSSIEASMEAYGGRASQIFQLARAVWSGANLPRLHTVLQGWTPNAGISEFALTAPRWVALGGGRVAPWTLTTDYALHANLDGDMRYDGTSTRDPLDSLIAANGNNSPTVFNYMANAMRTGGGYSMSGLTTAYAAQKAMIANYGNPNVICYEGGSHLCVPPERSNNANWIATFINYHASQIWADVYQENVENWYDAFGPSNTYVFKSDIRMPDQNNGYGILRWSGDTVNNPRLAVFNNNVNTRVGDGTRGANDFVGTFDTTDGYAA